ncbi:MAG: hypothetical protein WC558_07120 [Patulibacter sp.]
MRQIVPIVATATGTAILALAPAIAHADGPPAVKTGLAGSLTPQSASVVGTVNANGLRTRYFFDYGTSKKYGARTARQNAGSGATPRAATAGVSGLKSNTTYHYRLVATNAKGTVRGANRTFKTPKQPLGFSVALNPNPFVYGAVTMVVGTLGGTGSANRAVQLQQQTWPYTGGWVPNGNALVTDKAGNFGFPLLALNDNSRFRVVTTGDKPTVSAVLTADVRLDVSAKTSTRTVNRGSRLRFSGIVRPAQVGTGVGVQRLSSKGTWVTVRGSVTRKDSVNYSRYATRARITRSGTYRVFVKSAQGNLTGHYSPSIKIRVRS